MAVMRPVIPVAVEGPTDEAVARRLIEAAGAELGAVYGKNGKANLLQRLNGYNAAARFTPWLVLMDLDRDADCAPPFRAAQLPDSAESMCFRVVVHELEGWLMADRETLARFLSVPVARLPLAPDEVLDPKRLLVDIARQARRREIREGIVPRAGSGRTVGPLYTSLLIQYAQTLWRPEVAERQSDSLRRCRVRLHELVARQIELLKKSR
jgi:hypothetical protein